MKCMFCGAEIADDSKFCPECGKKIEQQVAEKAEEAKEAVAEKAEEAKEAVAEKAEEAKEAVAEKVEEVKDTVAENAAEVMASVENKATTAKAETAAPAAATTAPAKKSHKGLIIGLICGGVALIAAIVGIVLFLVLSGGGTTDVDLSKYVTVTFEGADGYGQAYVEFDESKLYKDLCKASKSFDKIYSGKGSSSAKARDAYYDMKDIDCELDKQTELSNGDKVKVELDFDNEAAEELGIKYVVKKSEYEVKDLKAVKEVDPFEGLTVTFEGTSPSVYVDIDKPETEDYYDDIYFSTKGDDYYFAKGDTVTIEVSSYYDEAELANKYGVKFTTMEKEYTVENVDAYVESYSEISEDTLADMKTTTESAVTDYFENYDRYIEGSDIKYEGMYFLKNNDEDSWEHNTTYVVYSAKVSSKDKEFKAQTVYFAIGYDDILSKADGTQEMNTTLSYIDSYDIKGETDIEFDDGWYKLKGYKTLEDLKADLIDSETDYTSEATAGL